jgi:hypothetical protein
MPSLLFPTSLSLSVI